MNLKIFMAILFTVISSSVFSQSGNNIVERSFACSVNSGYTINDVISAMRQNDWEGGSNPGAVLVREAVAVAGEFQNDWDFVVSLYYPSYTEMIERRVAFRNQSGGGTEGLRLRDVATCGDRIRINNVRFVDQSDGPIPEVTVAAGTTCQLNGASLSDAITGASAITQGQMGANIRNLAVISRGFGGPTIVQNSEVNLRLTFNSANDFGEAMDILQSNIPTPNPDNPLTCNIGGMWAQHLIYSSN